MQFLTPADLRRIDSAALEAILGRSDLIVAAGDGGLTGLASAALLFSGYAVLTSGATLAIDEPEAWAGAAWRLGRRAVALLGKSEPVAALEAAALGLCDAVIESDPADWYPGWMRHRTPAALDAAWSLIRQRGGDALERAEFARLFAIGDPQRGLQAFLARRRV